VAYSVLGHADLAGRADMVHAEDEREARGSIAERPGDHPASLYRAFPTSGRVLTFRSSPIKSSGLRTAIPSCCRTWV